MKINVIMLSNTYRCKIKWIFSKCALLVSVLMYAWLWLTSKQIKTFLCKMNNKSELKQKLLHAVGIKF